ncbi:MAG: hypothetical protein LBL47_01830 [Lactobacillus sp.]|nr:hypothetical protein [Lactobacillus sp.]
MPILKKIKVILFLAALLAARPALASNAEVFSQVYHEIYNNYIEKVDIDKLAIQTLKDLSTIDRKVRIADDKERLSLYYDAAVIKSYKKPTKENDIKAWGILSAQILKDAARKSEIMRDRDFRLVDDLLKKTVVGLGNDSKYYSALDVSDEHDNSIRYFGSRRMDSFLYLKIGDFNFSTHHKVREAINENPDIEGIILDLRGNKGGNLSEAIKVIDLFLDEGVLIATQDRNKQITYYNASSGDIINGKPIVILVDGDTASSAEAVTISLKGQGRTKVIGTSTFGKGTVQSLVNLANDSVLSLTTAEFISPEDIRINGVGISPDICVTKNCLPESRVGEEADVYTALKTLESQ